MTNSCLVIGNLQLIEMTVLPLRCYDVRVEVTVVVLLVLLLFSTLPMPLCVCLQLKLMATVHQTQPNIQMLLATNDYVGALDLISATQDILTRDLAGIHSFRYHQINSRMYR